MTGNTPSSYSHPAHPRSELAELQAEQTLAQLYLHEAAPGLLAACQALLKDCPYADLGNRCACHTYEDTGSCCHVVARVMIARATGK